MASTASNPVRLLGVALILGSVLAAASVRAAEAPPGDRPANGTRMSAIEQHYGAPISRYPAVGQPPITRWDYPTMVVYFEHDRLIHAVLISPSG
ncbi:MAG TPA: hypothetical protein VN790_05570 [Steroidobacteraceae bacterium]|nr:hypothetical protein [Steroidobacteraceae bacterium]